MLIGRSIFLIELLSSVCRKAAPFFHLALRSGGAL